MRHNHRLSVLGLVSLTFGTFAAPRTTDAALELDADFWDDYVPFRQYTETSLRELNALEEGDLLATGRDIDGLELRVIGRQSPASVLVSARAVIDSVARRRLQVKVVPLPLSPDASPRPRMQRRQLAEAEAERLLQMLESSGFWIADYDPGSRGEPTCDDPGHWIVEAVRPGSYQLIARTDCGELDPIVTGIRDYLLGLADVALEE